MLRLKILRPLRRRVHVAPELGIIGSGIKIIEVPFGQIGKLRHHVVLCVVFIWCERFALATWALHRLSTVLRETDLARVVA